MRKPRSVKAARPARPGGWRWPRRSSGRPARRGGSRRWPCCRGPAAGPCRRSDTSPRVAAQSRRPVVAVRVGTGHPAQRLRQARKGMHRRQRAEHHVLHAGGVAQPVGQRFARGHGAVRRHLVDDVVDTGDDHCQVGLQAARACSSCSVCAVSGPTARQQLPATRALRSGLRQRRAASCCASASRWWSTPTPAADESPATSRRSTGPWPTRPWRGPAGLGQARQARARDTACATSSGLRASLRSATWSELREVGLALLEEGLEGFHRLGAAQALANSAPSVRMVASICSRCGRAHQLLGAAAPRPAAAG
jgi:hypothetical protein